jgi:hypothetical protein
MIITSEADIAKVPSPQDRRELRNFQRWLRLWPHHSFDMIQRPRWQKYLGLDAEEVSAFTAAALKGAGLGKSDG